jgi:hypothetical protein
LKIIAPKISTITNPARKIKNRIFAIPAAPSAIPENPKIAATIAINKNVADHFNITVLFRFSAKREKLHATAGRRTAFDITIMRAIVQLHDELIHF